MKKIKLRNRIVKATHHTEFLRKCVEAERVLKGLQTHYQEIHLTDFTTITKTHATQTKTYKHTEQNVCKALIKHCVQFQTESEKTLEEGDKAIQQKLKEKAPKVLSTYMYKAFLNKVETPERNFRSLLLQRKTKTFTAHPSHTHSSFPHPRTHDQTSHAHRPRHLGERHWVNTLGN